MTRFKAIIEYDGTGLFGWQKQPNGPSVQEYIEIAIKKFTNQEISVNGSGRTDAGVHAFGQVAHFDLETKMSEYQIQSAINAHLRLLKANVSVLDIKKVADDFDARFSATKRGYIYKIINQKAQSPLNKNRAWQISIPLDIQKMQEASQYLIGTHDFTSFRASECQAKSPIKTVERIEIISTPCRHCEEQSFVAISSKPYQNWQPCEISLYFEAKSFLHHQVRNFVGTLKMVGTGKIPPEDIKKILEAKDRSKAGETAPAHGLYMNKIWY